jgi:hypothetical protein
MKSPAVSKATAGQPDAFLRNAAHALRPVAYSRNCQAATKCPRSSERGFHLKQPAYRNVRAHTFFACATRLVSANSLA